MVRLTDRNPLGIGKAWLSTCKPDDEEIEAVYRRLKEYEDLEEQGRLVKFYHCESLNEYYIGKRCGNFYYAKAGIQSNGDICLYYKWSRYLPWGEHIVDELSLWKGYTYPSEPKEISFEEWLKGWLREESVGRINRCRK